QKWVRGLQINNPYHGAQIAVPGPVHMHRIGIYDNGSFEHGRAVMLASHQDAGVAEHCTILTGLERMLRAFAHDTLDACPNGLRGHIKFIVPYGQYLTERGRRLLQQAFGGRVLNRYGMSEVFGGASENENCGWMHFDPSVLPQVIDRDGAIIREGRGLLVLTA